MAPPNPSSADGGGNKVCIVVPCYVGNNYQDTSVYYKIFVVPPVRTSWFALISPTLEIHSCGRICDGSVADGFCVLGGTLYMFEGYRSEMEKSVFAYNLLNAKNQKLKKSDLTYVAAMLFPKNNPVAIPTPDGKKILVSSISFGVCEFYDDPGQFELFDPVDGSSEALPSLLPREPARLNVRAHGFISKFKYAVHIDGLATYCLDLSVPKKCWEKLREDMPCHLSFFVIDDRFCFSPDKVEDLRSRSFIPLPPCVDSFPTPAADPDDNEDILNALFSKDRRITLLKHDEGGRNCDFCVVHSETYMFSCNSTGSYYPWCLLIIQIYHADYPEESGKVEISLCKSLKLYLRAEEKVDLSDVFPPCFFAV